VVYLEPIALALSKKSGRPVKMVMTREEVFRASGPTSGAHVRVKIGVKKDGSIVAAEAELKYQAGAFAGSPVQPGAMCAYAPYDLENVKVVGYDVVTNRPKVAAYRAPGGPISEYAVESVIDEIAGKIGMDPIELRLKNAAKQGTKAAYGPKFGPIGMVETLEAAKAHEHWRTPLAKNQGGGIASGFWFNVGGETSVSLQLNEDGTLSLTAGTPDIGGLRASLCMMAAEELGVDMDKIRVQIGDTGQLGYNFLTGGSRPASRARWPRGDRDRSRPTLRAGLQLWRPSRPGRVLGRHVGARRARRQVKPMPSRTSPRWPARPAARSGASAGSTPRARARASARTWWTSRWIRRPGARRSCATRWPRTRAGRCIRPTSRGSTRAGRCRASAGRSTRSTSTGPTASCRTRASSTTACRWPAICR
jgi:hypothetical protein